MPYDAFISYSHEADGRLAPAVQQGLQRLARPWYRIRALRVFRDATGLAVNPHLWTSIEGALDDSDHFVLLASPEAAASPWVARELEHWLVTKPPERILPVLTDGELVWDEAHGRYDPILSTALPAALATAYVAEPRHLDLRWARSEAQLDLRHPRFRDAIADLAAPMHGISKDDLEGEDVRQHRRVVRLTGGAALLLLLVTTLAVLAAGFAVSYASTARHNERRALAEQHRARLSAREASTQRGLAVENATTARTQRKRAEDNATQAKANASEAERQQTLAVQNQAEAEQNASEAAANAEEASRNGALAERQAANARASAAAATASAQAARASATEALRSAAEALAQKQNADVQASLAEDERSRAVASEQDARRSATLARSRALAASARNLVDSDGAAALLLATQAQHLDRNFESRDSLFRVLRAQPESLRSYIDLAPDGGETQTDGVVVSPDGRLVVGTSRLGSVTIADAVTRERLHAETPQPYLATTSPLVVSFSPDSSRFAVIDPLGAVSVRDRTGAEVGRVEGGPNEHTAAAISPDDEELALASAGSVVVVPATGSGPPQVTMPLPGDFVVFDMAFAPDGTTLAVAGSGLSDSENRILRFDVATGAAVGPVLHGQTGVCLCVDIGRDVLRLDHVTFAGRPAIRAVASGVHDSTVATWDLETGDLVDTVPTPDLPHESIVAISGDLRRVATTSDVDGDVRVRALGSGALAAGPFDAHQWFCDTSSTQCGGLGSTVGSVAFEPDGAVIAVGADGIARVFDPVGTGPLLQRTIAAPFSASADAVSADGSRLVSSDSSGFAVRDTADGRVVTRVAVADANGGGLALSADGHALVTLAAGPPTLPQPPMRIVVTDVDRGAVRWSRESPLTFVTGVAFSADGTRIAVTGGGATPEGVTSRLLVLDAATGAVVAESEPSTDFLGLPTFARGDRSVLVATFLPAELRLYDARTGARLGSLADPRLAAAGRPAVAADGLTTAIPTGNRAILVVDLLQLRIVGEVRVQGTDAAAVTMSPDGTTLAATFLDRPARLFDVASGQPLGEPVGDGTTTVAAFADGGRTLVLAGGSTPLTRIDVDRDDWATTACSLVGRNLTAAEWARLVGPDEPYAATCPEWPTR